MIAIVRLRYIHDGTGDLTSAVDFAQSILGPELVEHKVSASSA